ncbi:MAG: FkbM family methyltransferase [Beijerinckiaceae bacterium]|nr:FkbM family methyltransferase [Beijerinckiaceae bacterium]MCI0734730.1 FkbM family methyltransferase [Beijerinckiaceae bacterium]
MSKSRRALSSICYAVQRNYWRRLWPIRRGMGLPATIAKRLTNVPLWTHLEPSVTMLLDPRDLISRVLLETGEWELDTWQAIAAHLSPRCTFVDVGAHIGYCSLKAAAVVGLEGRVVAIEANPTTVKLLRQNVHANAAAIMVQPLACTDSETFVDLFAASDSNSGSSSISQANASQYGASLAHYRVQARPLDAILNDLGILRVDVLKIDVEGAEMQVLLGASHTLMHYQPVLMIELDDQLLGKLGTSSADICNLLASYGYIPSGKFDGIFDAANVMFVRSAVS